MTHQHAVIESTVYFWFAANDTSGSGGDGATPLYDVRLAGGAAGLIPELSGTPTLLTHANFPAGCHEIAVAATAANGFAATNTYGVFCTIAIDSQNPSGFVGSFTLAPVIANVTEVSGDSTAADNLESQYDGNGLTGDNFPSTQAQVGGLSVGSGGISFTAESFTQSVGSVAGGTYTDTHTKNGVVHDLDPTGNDLDAYYEADASANGIVTSFNIDGYVNGVGDTLTVEYWNWIGSAWAQIESFSGSNSTTVVNFGDLPVQSNGTGTGANLGLCRCRVFSDNGASVKIDRLLFVKTAVQASSGYDDSSVWTDEDNGTSSGTTAGTDGIVTNRSDDFDNAQTIMENLGYTRLTVTNGNDITLSATLNTIKVRAEGATIQLGGQDIGGARFQGPTVTGIGTGASPVFDDCFIGTVTLPPCAIAESVFDGTMTFGSSGTYTIFDCGSNSLGGNTFDLNGTGNNTMILQRWAGSVNVIGMAAGDDIEIDGVSGGTVTINGTGGAIEINGIFEEVVDSSGGSVSINQTATLSRRNLTGYAGGQIHIDTINGTAGQVAYTNGVAELPSSSLADSLAISVATGLREFKIIAGSTVNLIDDASGMVGNGSNWNLGLAGQLISGAQVNGANVSGSANAASTSSEFNDCHLAVTGLSPAIVNRSSVDSSIELLAAGDYRFTDCVSGVAGAGAPSVDMGAAIGGSDLEFRRWSGGLTITNIKTADVVSVDALTGGTLTLTLAGGLVEARGAGMKSIVVNGTSGTVNVTGFWGTIIDNSGGSVTITKTWHTTTVLNGGDYALDTDANGRMRIVDGTGAGEINTNGGAIVSVTTTDTATALGADAVDSTSMADGAITAPKIGADAITNDKIADDAIAAENLATGALTADAFAANALIAATFAANSLDGKGDWNTVEPDPAGTAPTAVENRQEMDSNSTQLAAIVEDTGEIGTAGAGLTSVALVSTGLDAVLVDGRTLPNAMEIIAAGVVGKISGAGTGTEVFVGLNGSTTRASVTVDGNGNRTGVVYV